MAVLAPRQNPMHDGLFPRLVSREQEIAQSPTVWNLAGEVVLQRIMLKGGHIILRLLLALRENCIFHSDSMSQSVAKNDLRGFQDDLSHRVDVERKPENEPAELRKPYADVRWARLS